MQVELESIALHFCQAGRFERPLARVETEGGWQELDDPRQVSYIDEASRLRVKLGPCLDERLGVMWLQRVVVALHRNHVVLEDEGDEHLEDDVRREDHVAQEEGYGEP